MASPAAPVHSLSEYAIIDIMKHVDTRTLKRLVSSLPTFFRVFQRNRATIYMTHLGNAYIKYGVPASLVEAMHYIRLLELRHPDAFWSDLASPPNRTPSFVPTLPSLGCLELVPNWPEVVRTCYRRTEVTTNGDPNKTSVANFALPEGENVADGIKSLLRHKTLRWLEVGADIVEAVVYVADKLDIDLHPLASASPAHNNDDVYPLRGYRAVRYLQPWIHELRCDVKGAAKAHVVEAFGAATVDTQGNDSDDDDDDEDIDEIEEDNSEGSSDEITVPPFEILREEIFGNPWTVLEEQAAAANRRQVAARLAGDTTLPTGRDALLGQIFWSEDEEKQTFEEKLWRSGSSILARLGHMSPEQRQEFLLVQYHASNLWF